MAEKTSTKNSDDRVLDQKLRPSVWHEYIGQENIKKNLDILFHPPLYCH